jgi:hypothetical protein
VLGQEFSADLFEGKSELVAEWLGKLPRPDFAEAEAAALIECGRVDPLGCRLLAIPSPTLEFLDAASMFPEGWASKGLIERLESRPAWDATRRTLTFRGRQKRYRSDAGKQMLVLAAFEEEGWPEQIDDPIEPGKIRDTVKALNENLPIRFSVNGDRVAWTQKND